MKYKWFIIKGIPIKIIKIDGKWYYKHHFCHCGCDKHIPGPTKSTYKNHKSRGIPRFINGHSRIDKHPSKETRNKMSISGSIKIFTRKHRNNMSRSQKKRNKEHPELHPLIGTHPTKETLIKLSKAASGENNPMFGLRGKDNPNFGRKCSPETILKMSGKNSSRYGKPSAHGKGCYYWNPFQGDVWLRSTWELAYAKYLDKKQISWFYEHKAFELSNNSTYRPDFYLLKKRKYIEIKGYMRYDAQEKLDLFRQEYPDIKLKVLYKEDMIRKGIKI